MTDHRRRAEEVYETLRNLGEEGHPIGWGDNSCASENEGDICCIEKGKNVLVDSVASALKEVEEETWARTVERVNRMKFTFSGTQPLLTDFNAREQVITALREEARKEGVNTDCCGHKACCGNKR